MDPVTGSQWIAMALLFLMSSIWSEDNVRFGYILVPFMTGFFWLIGWIQFSYLGAVIPLIIMMGVVSYLRGQLRNKYGVAGSSGGLLFKIVTFLIFLQMAIGFINGLALFSGELVTTPDNEYTHYTLDSAEENFAGQSSGIDIVDAVSNGVMLAWTMFKVVWMMFAAVFFVYPLLVTAFHIPASLSILIQCGIYVLYGAELFTMIFKPYQPVTV